ncbi:MAG: hypothetical protein H7Y04_01240 [Verrucomicrobia bacterium]|nr:hypothetical protein [Cytophagales bacterium]
MEQKDLEVIMKAFQAYYPLGMPDIKNGFDKIREVIGAKIREEHILLERWFVLVTELKQITTHQVYNLYYTQFPNLMVTIDQVISIGNIKVNQRFILCFSLLCTYFTYFYDYHHRTELIVKGKGGLSMKGIYFLNNDIFEELKIDIPLEKINEIIKKHFPEYHYLYHYDLMMHNIVGGYPIGYNFQYDDQKKYSIYQYLFDLDEVESRICL